jgi:hypothetical protein
MCFLWPPSASKLAIRQPFNAYSLYGAGEYCKMQLNSR